MATKKPVKKTPSLSSSEVSFLKDMIKYKKAKEKLEMQEDKLEDKMKMKGKIMPLKKVSQIRQSLLTSV